MAVVIRLSRQGTRNSPFFRVVAADKARPIGGRFLEIVGTYDPKDQKGKGRLKSDRIQHWISKGAIPSATVAQLIKRSAA